VRILVTGGSGFVGENLIPRLVKRGHDVVSFDARPAVGTTGDVDYEFIAGDVTDAGAVSKAFKSRQFDLVYHLAAIVGIRNYIERPFDLIDVNIIGTRNVMHECLVRGTRLLFTSTSELFGKNPRIPWKENDDRVVGTTNVERWAYGNTKAIGEHMLFAAWNHRQFPMSIVRYFNLYGAKQHPTNVVPRLVCRALSGKPLLVYDDGRMERCFTYIDDAIEATMRAAERPEALGEAFNIGRDTPTTIGELANRIRSVSGNDVKVDHFDPRAEFGKSYEDIGARTPHVGKIEELLGWKATTGLDDGLAKTIAWYDKNRSWWANFSL
jgi:nucleoside-diphosphate-sugar epimerase